MGYNSKCSTQTCTQKCCNYYGSCPNPSSSSTYSNKCWYYYTNTTTTTTTNLNGGGIAGVVVGGVFGLVILIIVIVCLVRKCRGQQPPAESPSHDHQHTIVVNTTQHQLDPMGYNNPYGATQTFAQPYVQPTPIYPQQIYQQPNDPYGYPQPYQQPQPGYPQNPVVIIKN